MVAKVDTVQGAADTTSSPAIVNVVGYSRLPTITISGVASDGLGGSGVAMVTVLDTFRRLPSRARPVSHHGRTPGHATTR